MKPKHQICIFKFGRRAYRTKTASIAILCSIRSVRSSAARGKKTLLIYSSNINEDVNGALHVPYHRSVPHFSCGGSEMALDACNNVQNKIKTKTTRNHKKIKEIQELESN